MNELGNLFSDLKLNLHAVKRLADFETPLSLYVKLSYAYSDSPMFLLESVEQHEMLGRFSFIGVNPFLTIKVSDNNIEIEGIHHVHLRLQNLAETFETVKHIVEKIRNSIEVENHESTKIDTSIIPMALVILNYESVKYFEEITFDKAKVFDTPDILIIFPSIVIVFDNYKRLMWNVMTYQPSQAQSEVERELLSIEKYPVVLKHPFDKQDITSKIQSHTSKKAFCEKIQTAKDYIYQGDIFQVVLSQRFSINTTQNDLHLYRKLRLTNPSPYMFLVQTKDFSLFGSSPETLVKFINKKVIIHPIAGTRKRGMNAQEDEEIEKELLTNEKELAEHSMLVDLARNDIGRVAIPGTVKVPRLMYIEKYSHVMHIVSEVVGVAEERFNAFDVIRSVFPAGTVTGAPKLRAMEIIEQLEDTSREFYAGSVGYISWSGDADFAITIRSAVLKDEVLYTQSGAGIVYDSIPENEYEETMNKAKAIFSILAMKT
ncbi:MAG: anthranilate synthase component I family protein [Fervidobacterium sp.]|nr:anthranilate synthase component I family protein [Fervidobacterium sp.]